MPINFTEVSESSHLELIARQVVEGFITGLHKSPFHGFSVEFAEHRIYNTGEPTRHIDWKLFGRSDKMFVKRYEEETNLRCQIVLDCSSSMYYPVEKQKSLPNNKLNFSIYCAASIIYMLKRQRDAVGLSIFDEAVKVHTHARSNTVHQKMLFRELENVMDVAEPLLQKTNVASALHEIAENIHKRSLVVIFSDMFENTERSEELFSALQHLKHNKHEVILFHVHDAVHEVNFNFENRPYLFVDMETGEEVKISSTEIKDVYVSSMKDYLADLKLRCGQFKIDFVEADINQSYKQVLLPYLTKRQHMLR